MNFQYKESNVGRPILFLKTNQGVEIEVFFGISGDYIYVDDAEFSIKSDTLYGLFVGIGDKIFTLMDVYYSAENQLPDILACVAQEQKDEESHIVDMSHSSRYI